jgi:hypothetical protein
LFPTPLAIGTETEARPSEGECPGVAVGIRARRRCHFVASRLGLLSWLRDYGRGGFGGEGGFDRGGKVLAAGFGTFGKDNPVISIDEKGWGMEEIGTIRKE